MKSQFIKLGGDIGISAEDKNTDEFVRKLEQTLIKEFKLKRDSVDSTQKIKRHQTMRMRALKKELSSGPSRVRRGSLAAARPMLRKLMAEDRLSSSKTKKLDSPS